MIEGKNASGIGGNFPSAYTGNFQMVIMDELDIAKIATAVLVAIITALIRLIYIRLNRDGERRKIRSSSVELLDKLINEREWKKKENRLIIEETVEQIFFKPVSYDEIKVLLYANTPSVAFRTYLTYRPVVELNEAKSKFTFKKNKRPYWVLWSIKIHRSFIKGLLGYLIFAIPSAFTISWILSDSSSSLDLSNLIALGVVAGLFWLMGGILLIDGMKYQSSEKELVRDLGEKFKVNNTAH
ncbi:hypothetical protein EZV61_13640 [Corallincola luteus]|uniref:Uncharacterized protein n=1 Tax=Corallincola luteus TaxID=1775177 RepID=A0ABY2AM58_9GAMM|nr:hypothetical protein [Corallincola luteus]TCI02396.1 hypothetical protein EZV61_13640 [Corallincola luteus]